MNNEDLITLNEEIAGMARAGLPLEQGLAALARELGHGRLQKVTAQLSADLEAGHPLPEAIERQGKRMPPFYAGLIGAGIRAGRVDEVLATLTIYGRTVANLRTLIVDALWYPALVLAFGLFLFAGIVFYLLPYYDRSFREMGMQIPKITEVILIASREPVRFLILPAGVLIGGLILTYTVMRFTRGGRRRWARWLYAIPLLGTVMRSARLAAFTELLAILIDYELPLPQAFEMAGLASSDPIMAGAAREVVQDLQQGQPLGKVMHNRHLVPDLIAWMTAVGEQRGTLGKTLHHVAELYRRQVEMRAALLRTVLPPFLIIVIAGFFACFFVFVMVVPMIKLLEALSR
jgi:type II secretory pathway component PulF